MTNTLWAEKYRPKRLADVDFHYTQRDLLKRLARTQDLPHLLFYGPSGSGKKTRVLALLQEMFGSGITKVKKETRQFKVGPARIEIQVIQSNFHIDLTPSDAAFRDKSVVQQIIKEIGSSKNPDGRLFKVIVLNQADCLSNEAQAALRRTMEKYTRSTRLVLLCNSLCRVIAPLRSRCLGMRTPAPEPEVVKRIVQQVAQSEGLELPRGYLAALVEVADGNLRRALMTMQTQYIQHGKLGNSLPVPEWIKYVKEIVQNLMHEQTPKTLRLIRMKLFDLLANCLPPSRVLHVLCLELCEKVHPELKSYIVKYATDYESRLKQGMKAIIHIEAFIARTMYLVRQLNPARIEDF